MTLRSRVGMRRGAAITGMALLTAVTAGLVGASNANAVITKRVRVKVTANTGCVTVVPSDTTPFKSVLVHGGAGWKDTGMNLADGSDVMAAPWTGTSVDRYGRCNGTLIRQGKTVAISNDRSSTVDIDLTTP